MGVGSLRGKYAIAGIGETEYSRNSGRTTRAMAVTLGHGRSRRLRSCATALRLTERSVMAGTR